MMAPPLKELVLVFMTPPPPPSPKTFQREICCLFHNVPAHCHVSKGFAGMDFQMCTARRMRSICFGWWDKTERTSGWKQLSSVPSRCVRNWQGSWQHHYFLVCGKAIHVRRQHQQIFHSWVVAFNSASVSGFFFLHLASACWWAFF